MGIDLEPINCIITHGMKSHEKKFLSAYLEWLGLEPEVLNRHSLSTKTELHTNIDNSNSTLKSKQICIWHEPNPFRIKDLIDEGYEILALGRLDQATRKILVREGIARLWSDMIGIANMPVYYKSVNPNSLLIWIYTGDFWMDRILSSFFVSMGQKSICPLEASHLFENLLNEKPDIIILDWDSVFEKYPNFYFQLEKFSNNNHIPAILGIKDYYKINISIDLSRKISKFCKINLPRAKLFSSLLFSMSLPTRETSPIREIQRLKFDRLIRGGVKSIEMEWMEYPNFAKKVNDIHLTWKWFEWLLDSELF